MQKRVVGNINELNEAARKNRRNETANGNSINNGVNRGGSKANKTGLGRFKKFAVVFMLLIVSVFCAIGSADWIISQQEKLPGGSDSTFIYDKKTLQNYIALKGSDESEAAIEAAEAYKNVPLRAAANVESSTENNAVSAYANGLEDAVYGKSAIYNGKPIVAIKKTAGVDNAAADLPDEVLSGSLLTSYKPLSDGSVTEADLTEAYFDEGETSGLPQNAGTYAILIKINGLEAYGYAVKIFTILPCPVTVEWSGVDFANGFTYDGTAHAVTATAKIASGDNGNVGGTTTDTSVSYSVSRNGKNDDTVKNAGNYTLTADLESGNYVINKNETVSFTVNKAPLTVTADGKTITYGDNLPEFTASYSGFVNGETSAVLSGTLGFICDYVKGSPVGTYNVTPEGLTSDNYKIEFIKGLLTVKQYGLKVNWSDLTLTFTYDKTAHSPTATVSNPIAGLTAPVITVTTNPLSAINAGSYTATASVTDTNYYITDETKSVSFTIGKRTLTATVNVSETEITFGDEAPEYSVTFGGAIDGDDFGTPIFECSYKKGSPVGKYTVTAKNIVNGNYNVTVETATFSVKQYGINVTWSDLIFTYNKTARKPTATVSNPIAGLAEPVITVTTYSETGVAADAIDAGSYTATASVADTNYYITNETKSISFTIGKRTASVTVTLPETEIAFGSETPTATINYSGVISGDSLGTPVFDYGGYKKGSDIGTYTVTVSSLKNDNYDIKTTSASFTVTPYGLNIEWSDTDLKYTGNEQKPKATIKNPIADLTEPLLTVTTYMPGNDTPISTRAIGDYIAKASVSDGNYYISSGETTDFTISRIQVAIPTSGDNMLEYTGNELIYKPAGFDGSTMTITGNTNSSITEYAYKAEVSLKDSTYEWSDKTNEPKTFVWYIVPSLVRFDGILEKTYEEAKTGIALDANVFTNLVFKNGEKANTQASGAASTIKATDGNGNDYTETSPDNIIKVGSTYKAEIKLGTNYCFDIQVDETANKCTFNREGTTYIKYQTAKIGDNFYTIEDALAKSGDITIIGDSTDDTSYIITAFSKLGLSSSVDSAFSDYKYNYAYTLSEKLIVSFDGQNSTEFSHNKNTYTKGFVNSAFIIPNGVNLTLAASANLIIGAAVTFNQQVSTTVAMNRGVIMNNGQITAQNGSNITSYGYIKGAGNIIMQNGSKAVDALAIYDWPGGSAASSMYNNVFPSNAYTMHNISCKTVIYAGAIYSAKVYVYMKKSVFEKEVDVEQIIIGTQSQKGMFNLTNDSDKGKTDTYIIKSVTTYNGNINSSITSTNQRIMQGSNQYLNHRDKIEIYGNYSDDSLKITVDGVLGINATLENNTSKPLPVGFMDVSICRGTMNLTKSDYLILPGATIKVEKGGTLNLGSNVDIVAMPYSSMPTGIRGYSLYYTSSTDGSGKKDGKLIINGTLTGNGYNLGGKILTEAENSTLTVVNTSGSYVTLISYNDPYYQSGTLNAVGNIMTDRNNYGEANFSAGTYYSKNVGTADSPEYAWFKNTATVTYVLNGGTLNGSKENYIETATLTANGYTNMPVPSKPYYTFGGWFFDSDLSETATSVYTSCTLYAKWNPIEYTVKYHFASSEYGTLNDEKLFGNEIKALPNPPKEQLTINGVTLTFAGWYLTSDYSGSAVSSVSAANANGSQIINVYANFINADTTYNVFFELNPEGITDNTVGMIMLDFDKKSVQKGEDTEISSLVDLLSIYDYNTDYKSNYYFSGWYLSTDETQTVITVLPSTISEDLTLCAKWEKKNSVTVRLESNDLLLNNNNNFVDIVEYYQNGSLNLQEIYDHNKITKLIDDNYAAHGSVKEYYLTNWKVNGVNLESSSINLSGDLLVTAYHKRCYYITVVTGSNVKGVTGGTGTYYVSSLDSSYNLSVKCSVNINDRYTAKYTAVNASVDQNGKITFTTDSVNNITITVTTAHWYKVTNSYSDKISISRNTGDEEKIDNSSYWYTEGASIKVKLSGGAIGTKAKITYSDGTTDSMSTGWSSSSKDITVNGYITISKG